MVIGMKVIGEQKERKSHNVTFGLWKHVERTTGSGAGYSTSGRHSLLMSDGRTLPGRDFRLAPAGAVDGGVTRASALF